MNCNSTKVAGLLALTILAFEASPARGSGFGITAQGTSELGGAFSGQAAAEDPATVWYNPAGMLGLDGTRASMVTNVIRPSFKFHDEGSTGAFALTTNEGGDGGGVAVVPQIYATHRISDKLAVGLALNPAYGLQTEYDRDWRGRLIALKSQAKSINVNPAIAYDLGNGWWLGAGVSWQSFDADLTNFAGPAGTARLEASDSSLGFNAGFLYSTPRNLRVGLAFRSRIDYELDGDATFTEGAGALDSGARARLTVPETWSASVLVPVGEKWQWTANTTLTRWSRVKELSVTRTTPSALGPSGSVITVLPFGWKDAWFIATGAGYQLSPAWKLRFGVALDPRVSNDLTRTPRLPDQRRLLFAAGCSHVLRNGASFDVAFGHEIIADAAISNTIAGAGTLSGHFENSADVLSFQYNHRF